MAREIARPSARRSAGLRRDEALAGGDGGAEPAQDRALDDHGAAGLDQLPAHRAQGRVGDRREPERAVADEPARGRPEQRVALEARVERRGVVVEGEHEPGVRDACLGRGPDDDPAVGPLPGRCRRAVGERGVPGAAAAHQAEAVRAGRGDDVLDHVP